MKTIKIGQTHLSGDGTTTATKGALTHFCTKAIFGRVERVQKNSHELVLPALPPEGNFGVGAYSLGYMRDVVKNEGLDVGVGFQAIWNTNPAEIASFYGGTKHGGCGVFLRLRPSAMKHD